MAGKKLNSIGDFERFHVQPGVRRYERWRLSRLAGNLATGIRRPGLAKCLNEF